MYCSEYMRSVTCTIVPCQRLSIAVGGLVRLPELPFLHVGLHA
jgi:hypothetical protein